MRGKKWLFLITTAAILLLWMGWLLLTAGREAALVRENVLRYHVVANSDSPADQALKIKVRDGLFESLRQLFADCETREEAISAARNAAPRLETEARAILLAAGSEQNVQVTVGKSRFPTKDYGEMRFPAGEYEAVNVTIGSGGGKNFWCVLFPALCVGPAIASDRQEDAMAAVVGDGGVSFLERRTETQRLRFLLWEWIEKLQNP